MCRRRECNVGQQGNEIKVRRKERKYPQVSTHQFSDLRQEVRQSTVERKSYKHGSLEAQESRLRTPDTPSIHSNTTENQSNIFSPNQADQIKNNLLKQFMYDRHLGDHERTTIAILCVSVNTRKLTVVRSRAVTIVGTNSSQRTRKPKRAVQDELAYRADLDDLSH